MNCPTCRQAEMKTHREDRRYVEGGWLNVVLQNVEVRTCPECDETGLMLPQIAGLHRLIDAQPKFELLRLRFHAGSGWEVRELINEAL